MIITLDNIGPGSVLQLNSGGPKMTVVRFVAWNGYALPREEATHVRLRWFDTQGRLQTADFTPETLRTPR